MPMIPTSGARDAMAYISGLDTLRVESSGDPRVCVAVLDGPVDRSHPCFEGARLTAVSSHVPGAADRGPASAHGTHVAGILFGQPGGPVRGLAPRCRGLIVPIFSDEDGVTASCSQLDLARAITQAVQHGAHIINISGGEFTPAGEAHPLLADAVRSCARQGVLIVAAAGNDGCRCLHVPAAMPCVLAVGAMDAEGAPISSSNWGDAYQDQGILAPGENIPGPRPGGGVVTQSGTSFAAPIVSGVIALLASLSWKHGRKPDLQAIRDAVLGTARPCAVREGMDCQRYLTGRLNVAGAHARLARQTTTPDNSSHGGASMIKAGAPAPDFSALDHEGREIRLRDYRGKTVVLWFYPRADTPG